MSHSVEAEDYRWVHPAVLEEVQNATKLRLSVTPIVSSFPAARRALSDAHTTVIVPKDCVDDLDTYGFTRTRLAFPRGAHGRYRDSRSTGSLQLWEYDTYYVAGLNQFNPEQGYFIEHALVDRLSYTLGAAALTGAAYWWLSDE
jgi:hypothetical protein